MKQGHRESVYMIGILSFAHMCVDFLCVFSLFRSFRSLPEVFLIYSFCAFALQMPLGITADILAEKRGERITAARAFTLAGMVLTVLGAVLSPVIAGCGNALFHCGGGILTIEEDRHAGMKGRGLGVFVAPGALGLACGMLYCGTLYYALIRNALSCILLVCGVLVIVCGRILPAEYRESRKDARTVLAVCFLVVVLRSLCGMSVAFTWKTGAFMTLAGTFCLAAGKSTGGFLAARFGIRRTVLASLVLAGLGYAGGENALSGLCALFFFNMSMPLTLYLAAEAVPDQPGFAFGLLTMALFIGWLPSRYGILRDIAPFPAGTLISLVSLVLLLGVCREKADD